MAFFAYLIFGYNLISAVLTLISIALSYYGLQHQRKLSKKDHGAAPIITVFFGFMLIYSISWLLYVGYLLLLWRPDENLYNVQIFWAVSMLRACLSYITAVMETFLAIDRCLTIIFPTKYGKTLKKYFSFFTTIMLILIFAFVIWITRTLESYPTFTSTQCLYIDCLNQSLKRKYTYETKCVLVGINQLSGIALFLLFKFYNKNNTTASMKRINKTLLIIIFSSLLFDFAPIFLNQILSMVSFFDYFHSRGIGIRSLIIC